MGVTSELALGFKIIKSNQEQLVIPYHDLLSPFKFDGKSIIEISTSTLHITIEGQSLEKILDYISEHRLVWIKEPVDSGDTFFVSVDDDEITIDSIQIDTIN